MSTSRILVRSVTANETFDGTTAETSLGYSPQPTANGRAFKSGATVGRFGFGVQARKGISSALCKVRVYGAVIAGDRVEIRSGLEGITPVGDRDYQPVGTAAAGPAEPGLEQQDVLLEVFDLHNNFTAAGWHRLGPTDAICVYHEASGDGDTVEILIVEGDEAELAALEAGPGPGCSGDCLVQTVTVLGPAAIEPWECDLSVILLPRSAGNVFTLPPAAGMIQGATMFARREAGTPWCIVVGAGGETVNGRVDPEGVVFQDDDKGVLFRLTSAGWVANDIIPQLTPVEAAPGDLPAFAGNAVFDLGQGAYTLPSTALIAEGQMVWLTNREANGLASVISLSDPATENFNGDANESINLTNQGDTVLLVRDGGSGWRSVWNRWDRDYALTLYPENPVQLTSDWRGTRTYLLNSNDPDVIVELPLTPLVGMRAHVCRDAEGTITFDAGAGNNIVRLGTQGQTLTVEGYNNWSFLEYEGFGIWSYRASGGNSQARGAMVITDAVAVPLQPLGRDVTILNIECNFALGNVTLPSIDAIDVYRTLKIINSGTEALLVNPALGTTLNGIAGAVVTVPADGGGVELQPYNTAIWHVSVGATIA